MLNISDKGRALSRVIEGKNKGKIIYVKKIWITNYRYYGQLPPTILEIYSTKELNLEDELKWWKILTNLLIDVKKLISQAVT